jgi:acetylornithine deacetylase/succinyl-diaminopimelate desuccinylase-like protein
MVVALLLALGRTPLKAHPRASESFLGFTGAKAGDEGLESLEAIVRLDTSNPPGNEAKVAAHLAQQLRKAGLEAQLFESALLRASLMVRYQGSGLKKPLLILSHIDVVPGEKDLWSVPPFEGAFKDGFLWGQEMLWRIVLEAAR